MSHFDDALQRARRISDAFGMHPNVRNGEVSVTEGDNEAYYQVSPLGEGETTTMTPDEFAQWRAQHEHDNWT